MLQITTELANALRPLIEKIVDERCRNVLRVERYEVSTAANGTKMGVILPYGGSEIFLPYSRAVENASVGDSVLVLWRGTLSNGKVWCYGDGPDLPVYNGGVS